MMMTSSASSTRMAVRENFPPLQNDTILRAARGEPTEYVPLWVMRQAGRYLPEFQAVRREHSFFEVCQTPRLACEVTLQPLKRFPLDAAIIFSDILVIPQLLGMTVEMLPGEGPKFPEPLRPEDDLSKRLKEDVDVTEGLGYVYDAIELTRRELDGRVPLIGFSGGPWTLMCYMIEGGGTKTAAKAKRWLYATPERSHQLLATLCRVIVDHLVNQALAGAQLLQLFETSAGFLGPGLMETFFLPYVGRIGEQVKQRLAAEGLADVPLILFAKDALHVLGDLSHRCAAYDVISLDWNIPPAVARQTVRPGQTLQGNLDPCALYADKAALEGMVREMLDAFGTQNYIANLGHGIYPDMSPEAMGTLVEAVHSHSRAINNSNK